MAETTLLRSSALIRNASVGTSPAPGIPGQVKTGELPLVQVKTAPIAPQFATPPAKAVEILPPRDASSALRTGGLPMVSVKMTSQGPRPDDGQDKPVMILPPKGQKPSAGGPPMLEVNMTSGGPQVQGAQGAQRPPQNASFMWSQSRGTGVRGAAHPVNQQRVVRVPAPKPAALPLPSVPEFPADQLMLCRHLVNKYLMDLQGAVTVAQGQATSVEMIEGQGTVGTEVPSDVTSSTESAAAPATAESVTPGSQLARLAEATIETLDQALVAVAIRAEAAELAAAAEVQEAAPPAVQVPSPVVSSIPAAPSVSYMTGRAGGGGYNRPQRNMGQAPRRVARSPGAGGLPIVEVKMEGRQAVVQNQAEVAAARAARAAGSEAELDGNPLG